MPTMLFTEYGDQKASLHAAGGERGPSACGANGPSAPVFNNFDTFVHLDRESLLVGDSVGDSRITPGSDACAPSSPTLAVAASASKLRLAQPRLSGLPSYCVIVISFCLTITVLIVFTTLLASWQVHAIEKAASGTARASVSLIVSNLDDVHNTFFRNAHAFQAGVFTPLLCRLSPGVILIIEDVNLPNISKGVYCPPYGPDDVEPSLKALGSTIVYSGMRAGCPASIRQVGDLVVVFGITEAGGRVVQVMNKTAFGKRVFSSASPTVLQSASDSTAGLLINVPTATSRRQAVVFAGGSAGHNSSDGGVHMLSSILEVCRQASLLYRVSLYPNLRTGLEEAGPVPYPVIHHGGLGRPTSAALCAVLCAGNCSRAWMDQYSNFVVLRLDINNLEGNTLILVVVGTVALVVIVIATVVAMCLCITLPAQVLHDQIISLLTHNTSRQTAWHSAKHRIANSTHRFWAREMRGLSDSLSVFSRLYLRSARFLPEHRLDKQRQEVLLSEVSDAARDGASLGVLSAALEADQGDPVPMRRSKCRCVESASVVVVFISGVEAAYQTDAARASQQHNHLWSVLTSIARAFDGDVSGVQNASAIVFSWNAFCVMPNHARYAARCATQIAEVVSDARNSGVSIGIAASTGHVYYGELSDDSCAVDVLFGHTVEVAVQLSRLAARLPEVFVLVTEPLKTQVSIFFHCLVVDVIGLDADSSVTVYDLRNKTVDTDACHAMVSMTYSKAFSHFRQHEFGEAIGLLTNISGRDNAAAVSTKGWLCRLAVRLTNLCHHYHIHRSDIPVPYSRPLPQWRMYEADVSMSASVRRSPSALTPLPNMTTILQVQTVSTFGLASSAGIATHEEALRRDLQKELTDRTVSEQGTSDSRQAAAVNHDKETLSLLDSVTIPSDGCRDMLTSAWNMSITQGAMPRDADVPRELRVADGVVYTRSAKVLGQGTFGVVFLGMEAHTGKLVAMKVMPLPDSVADRQHIENEVLIMIRVRHQHLIEFLGYCIHQPYIILVMECVIAGSLASVLDSFRAFPLPTTANYLRHVIRGLQRLHEEGIMHRDVKPHNVLVTTMGVCKISDFGASARINQLAREERQGLIVHGTPVYLAPEAARGSPSYKSDVWSVGIMFIHIATGRLPYDTESMDPAVFVWQLGRGYIEPAVPPLEDEAADEFVRKCLQRDEAARPTTAELLACAFLQ